MLAWFGRLSRAAAALVAICTTVWADEADIFRPGAELRVQGLVAFLEGPAWHPNGNVFFSDVANNRIMRRDVQGVIHVYRQPSGRANGLAFDAGRRLLACEGAAEGGNRRVTRTETNGTITVLARHYKGKQFNSPNDLALDTQGRIYFTDPRYGDREGMEQVDAEGKMIEGVYRIDTDGKVTRILTHEVERPNGIAVSPGDQYLYVVDNNNSHPEGSRKIWRFELTAEGNVVPDSQKVLYDFGRGRGGDGMCLDVEGRLYIAAGTNFANLPVENTDNKSGIYVLSPEGELLSFVPVPEDMITNCTFGDPDLKTLYVTAGHKLWSIACTTPGYVPWSRNAGD